MSIYVAIKERVIYREYLYIKLSYIHYTYNIMLLSFNIIKKIYKFL